MAESIPINIPTYNFTVETYHKLAEASGNCCGPEGCKPNCCKSKVESKTVTKKNPTTTYKMK